MTIKDIAKESGYAIGTVSRVLNNNPSVSPAARAKILEVIKRYNYQPNSNAKHLKQQSSDGLALIVKGTQNMLFVDILEKMQAILEERGYVSTVYYIDEEANEVAQAELICAERKPYGIAFLGSNLEYFTPQLAELRVPCLLLTNSAATLNIPNLSSVSVDDVSASSLMIEYLYAQGHRKIGLIGGKPDQSRPSLSRLTGSQSAMFRLGLPFEMEKQYAYARFSLQSGYTAMEYLLKHCPDITAVFAMSDLMALGAIRALNDHGLRVPQDISVSGYDGIALGRYSNPRLTTIRQNSERLAQRGAEILLNCIENGSSAVHEVVTFAASSIICAFGLASAAPRSPYRHLELCGIAIKKRGFPDESKRHSAAYFQPALPPWHRHHGRGSKRFCGFPSQSRSGLLADPSGLPHQLWRQPLPVFFYLCGQSVFY